MVLDFECPLEADLKIFDQRRRNCTIHSFFDTLVNSVSPNVAETNVLTFMTINSISVNASSLITFELLRAGI